LHVSLVEMSQGGGPLSVSSPKLLASTPLLVHAIGEDESMVGAASTSSLPEELPPSPPELLAEPASALGAVSPPQAKASTGAASRANLTTKRS
jgi:hypothetical protein